MSHYTLLQIIVNFPHNLINRHSKIKQNSNISREYTYNQSMLEYPFTLPAWPLKSSKGGRAIVIETETVRKSKTF